MNELETLLLVSVEGISLVVALGLREKLRYATDSYDVLSYGTGMFVAGGVFVYTLGIGLQNLVS